VDDNSTNRLILERYTRQWGMKPTTVDSGKGALSLLTGESDGNDSFDIAIIDRTLPDMDGSSLAKMIRNQPNLRMCRCLYVGVGAASLKIVRHPFQQFLASRSNKLALRRG